MTWQTALVRVAVVVACCGVLMVLGAAAMVAASPEGPRADRAKSFKPIALPVVVVTFLAFMLLVVGIFREREKLAERLPQVTGKRILIAVVMLLLVFPIFHLGFALCACLIGLAALTLLPTQEWKLRGIAVCDGLICLFLAAVMTHAGHMGDFVAASALLGIHTTLFTTVLPVIALLVSVKYLPRLAQLTCAGYMLAATHSVAITLQALHTLVSENTGGIKKDFGGVRCLRSIAASPSGLVLGWISAALEADPYEGPRQAPDPCAAAAPVSSNASAATCEPLGFDKLFFFILVGAYILACVVACTICPFESRVVPEDVASPKSGMLHCLCKLGRSVTRLIVLATLVVGAVLVGWIGSLALRCSESSAAHATSVVTTSAAPSSGGNCTTTPAAVIAAQAVSTTVPMASCQCEDSGTQGMEAWLVVPVEQLAATWCELGTWAAMWIGLLLYVVHSYACTLALSRAAQYSAKAELLKRRAKFMAEPTKLPEATGPAGPVGPAGPAPELPAIGPASADAPAESALAVFTRRPQEPLPKPIDNLLGDRIFDV